MLAKTKIYAAYGSNLYFQQMQKRCTHAKFLDIGIIKGYELLFRGKCGNALATIELNSNTNFNVPVALWKIHPSDEYMLDIYEGFPKFYRKEILTVTLENNEEIEAMIYVLNNGELGFPSNHYYNIIAEGYLDNTFNLSYLKEAVEKCRI